MLLFNPSPGQIVDRITILKLKMSAAAESKFDSSALVEEYTACGIALSRKELLLSKKKRRTYTKLVRELRRQNQKQWDAEDGIRKAIRSSDDHEVLARLAVGTHLGNERRASLVASIDELFGEKPERKMYR